MLRTEQKQNTSILICPPGTTLGTSALLQVVLHWVIPLEQCRPVCSGRHAVLPGRQVVHNRIPFFHGNSNVPRLCQIHPFVHDTFEFYGPDPVRRRFQHFENRLMSEPGYVCLSRKQDRLDVVGRCTPTFQRLREIPDDQWKRAHLLTGKVHSASKTRSLLVEWVVQNASQ